MNAESSLVLTCPSCRTRYQAGAARFLPGGKNVRCAKCGQVWFQPAPELEPVFEESLTADGSRAPIPFPKAEFAEDPSADFGVEKRPKVRAPKKEPVTAKRRAGKVHLVQVAGWAVLLFMICGIGWAGIQYRQFIATVWPESASVYAAIGMPVNIKGMALADVSYKQDVEDGQPVLSVTGKVVNISNFELPVPELRAVLTDDAMREIYRWTFNAGTATLKAGAESAFVTRLSSPPPGARNLNVTFADGDG